ncbi:MAG TPA: hypothetical protein VFH50_07610 [Acidimicrobiales bacterium]|nr:hypothetical protein [Acidimicrobiales bacterium]
MGDSLATVTEVLQSLSGRGYDTDFFLDGNRVRCGACGGVMSASDLTIDEVYRFEGQSDPGDEMIVVAVECRQCGKRGTLVSAYGPDTSPEEAEVLLALQDGRPGEPGA